MDEGILPSPTTNTNTRVLQCPQCYPSRAAFKITTTSKHSVYYLAADILEDRREKDESRLVDIERDVLDAYKQRSQKSVGTGGLFKVLS